MESFNQTIQYKLMEGPELCFLRQIYNSHLGMSCFAVQYLLSH